MNRSKYSSSISYLSIGMLLCLYAVLLAIFALKTVYYYRNNLVWWWGYFVLLTLSFLHFTYSCLSLKPYRFWVTLFLSFVLGYMPFETEFEWIEDMIFSDQKSLSGIAEKLPKGLGLFFDIVFYPSLVFILLLTVKYVILYDQKKRPQ